MTAREHGVVTHAEEALRRRVGPGTPAGGQFAACPRPEVLALTPPDVHLPRLDGVPLGLPYWEPPEGTDDPLGAFSRCTEVSAEYTAHLREHGVDAVWVQVCSPGGEFPAAHERWRGLDQSRWQHYVTRTPTPHGPVYVDWTARQFDPTAGHPQVSPVATAEWAETYPIEERALLRFLKSWRHESNRG